MSKPSSRMADLSPQEKRALLTQLLESKARRSPSAFPLSYGQQALWLIHKLAPESWAYNVLFSVRICSEIDIPALQRAFQLLLDRHPSLRTTYSARNGEPEQHVHQHQQVYFEAADISTWRWEVLQDRLTEEARRPFDLEHGPLMRVSLFTRSTTEHILLLNVHHIAIDFWSLGVLLGELRQLYPAEKIGAQPSLPSLDQQYADYVRWQAEMLAGPEGEQLWAYWQQQLSGELPELSLPTDRPRPLPQTYRGATYPFRLNEALTRQLKALAKAEDATLYMVLLAAFDVLLHRYTGQEDILVGTFMADRIRPEFRRLVGYFVNPAIIRAELSGNPPFKVFLGQVRHTVLAALQHQNYPFPLLVERLQPRRDASRSPLFQIAFVLQQLYQQEDLLLQCLVPGVTDVRINFGELVLEPFALPQQDGQFDLILEMAEVNESLYGGLKYNADLFDAATIARMAGHFQTLLEGIVINPDQHISTLPLLTEVERQQLLVAWNDTHTDYRSDQCIHQLFEAQVERTPEAVAVVFENERLTYRELNRRANQLAHHLQSLGVGPEVLVGICLERSLEMMVGLLGILKAGGAYVPLDPAYPTERLALMLKDSRVAVLLTHQRLFERLSENRVRAVCLDTCWEAIAEECEDNPGRRMTADNLAYVIYTSGSTGKPKGVQISHRAVINFLHAMRQQAKVTDRDILLAVTTLSFDIAVLELFLPMTVGARLVVVSRAVASDGLRLSEQLTTTGATVMQATPATWRLLVEAGWLGNQQLHILCGGEALSPELAGQLLERCSSLWNLYGPTETTIWSSTYKVESSAGPVPIGRPIAMTQLYVLDPYLQPVPIGVPGELYIGGLGLARGYLNRPELTAEKFMPNPFSDEPGARVYKTGDLVRYRLDGTMEFLGRLDDQVKIRGFRIELGEIETILSQYPAVRQSVAMVREDTPGDKRLVAYGVTDQETEPTVNDLRTFLKQKLPDYMIPSTFIFLDAFPLTPNGKVDRRALPTPQEDRPELNTVFVAPKTEAEQNIAAVWQEVLHVDKVGTHDNFFDLGGHSLLVVLVQNKLQEIFKRDVPLVEMFKYPTVSTLVHHFTQQSPVSHPQQPDHSRVHARRAVVSKQRERRQSHRLRKDPT